MPVADDQPVRKTFGLKPREFERVNGPARGTPVDAATPTDVVQLNRMAAPSGPILRKERPAVQKNDVHSLLQENVDRANARGLNALSASPVRRSRRRRDYILVMVAGNALLGAVAVIGYYSVSGAGLFVSGVAGIGLFSVGFTWVMWGILDDY